MAVVLSLPKSEFAPNMVATNPVPTATPHLPPSAFLAIFL